MEVVNQRCAGPDVHKRSVVACLIVPGADGQPQKQTRTFLTMTGGILELSAWLAGSGCTDIAMESTGVYWKPLWNLLEGDFRLVLANAQHIKAVPGRKTDVNDAEWIADLLRHGLLPASFVPERPQRELRELTRYRTSLIRERAAEVNRLQKTLEGANIKLASVATDVMGESARQMLAALVAGDTDAAAMAQLAERKLRAKIPQLEQALEGRFAPHQRFLLAQQLAHVDLLEELVAQVGEEIAKRVAAFETEIAALDGIPGVGRRTAEVIVAEVGATVERFRGPEQLASWAGMCPGNHESAGKRQSGRTRRGNPWLRAALVEAAKAAGRTKDTYLGAQYRRLVARRGQKRAAVAVGHTILVTAYYLLKRAVPYQDLGSDYFERHNRQDVERHLIHHLESRGYTVTREEAAS
jgi:transposase